MTFAVHFGEPEVLAGVVEVVNGGPLHLT